MPKLISEFRKLLQCFLEVNKSMTMLSLKFVFLAKLISKLRKL